MKFFIFIFLSLLAGDVIDPFTIIKINKLKAEAEAAFKAEDYKTASENTYFSLIRWKSVTNPSP